MLTKTSSICVVFSAIHRCIFALSETLHMSPGVLADMWKDEGKRSQNIEEKIKAILKEKGVRS